MKIKKYSIALLLITGMTACEKFVQVSLPDSQIGTDVVFKSDETALAATNGIYQTLLQNYGLLGGSIANITLLTAMSSDEVNNYYNTDPFQELAVNNINVNNAYILSIWAAAYKTIYECNTVIKGVEQSTSLSLPLARQVTGEALFIRALCHFYLLNMFGNIPLLKTNDYRVTSVIPRTEVHLVYDQISQDLETAEELLTPQYFTADRTRPNKMAATALRARLALYQNDFEQAEELATTVMNDSTYQLEELSEVFLVSSSEAIWQLSQVVPEVLPTGDAYIFMIQHNFFQNALTENLLTAFEPDDLRKNIWTGQWTNASGTYWYAFKYKEYIAANIQAFKEYLVVLRLSELYLIRAEARAQLGKLHEAMSDLDVIRQRASLSNIADTNPEIGQEDLLERIAQEKRIEFFCEMGHRWFDLKRTGKVDQVLAPLKSNWNTEDKLYPIPETEMLSNPFLKPQNPGY